MKFNNWLAEKITSGVATMWCAYTFTAIALVGYPYGSKDAKTIIQWFAQEFLQLVLLSIILVGQKLQSDKHDDTINHLKALHNKIDGVKDES